MRALAISPDGKHAISGSFDTSAIRWSLERNVAEQVMRFHDAAVNAVAYLKDGRIVTGGADGKIAIWTPGKPDPDKVLEGHRGPVVTLAVSPDGATLASGSWDHTIRLWPREGRRPARAGRQCAERQRRRLHARRQGAGERRLRYDAAHLAARWRAPATVRNMPSPLNTVAVAPDGEIVAAGATGKVFFVSGKGEVEGEIAASATPVIDLAMSPDGKLIAAAGIRGSVAIIDRKARKLEHTLVGPGLPVWSVAFFPDSKTILTGGADRMIRRWSAVNGEPLDAIVVGTPDDPLAQYAGDHGAQVFRACVACHTLSPDEGNKAGPSLAGIFGRKIATLPGYRYSDALKHMDIVWTPETVSKMFEVGPMQYTPGTKMPEQKIGSAEDRQALMEFLKKATVK